MRAERRRIEFVRATFSFALRNVLRGKQRTLLSLAAIAFGVSCMVLAAGFVRDIYAQLAETLIHSQLGHIQIARKGYFDIRAPNVSRFLAEKDEVQADLNNDKAIVAAMSRLGFSALLSNGRTDVPVMAEGIEPTKEEHLGTSARFIAGRALSDADTQGITLGAGVARKLNLSEGDAVTVLVSTPDGALNTAELIVKGVFQTFFKDYDDHAVRLKLDIAQDLLGTSGIHALVIELDQTSSTADVLSRLNSDLKDSPFEARSWNQMSDFYEKTVQLYERQFGAMRLIIFFMVALAVFNVVNMGIQERMGEIGTMRAVGDTSSRIFWLIMTESTLLGLCGAVAGVLLGVSLAHLISSLGIPMPPPPNSDVGYIAQIRLTAWNCLAAAMTGLLAATLAAVRPARRASRADICFALRQRI